MPIATCEDILGALSGLVELFCCRFALLAVEVQQDCALMHSVCERGTALFQL